MADRLWTVRDVLDWTVGYLTEKGDEHPRRSAEWLVSAATGLSRVEVYAYFDRPLSPEERTVLRESVKRRGAGEPLQYVTGEVGFRHIIVKCAPGVLIPRPETEMLVEFVLPHLKEAVRERGEARVLEIGVGTGCVSLSIATEVPEAHVTATDISPAAIALAGRNAEALRLSERVELVECDLVAGLAPEMAGTFDLIVSNPPYIPTAELPELPSEVTGFEPSLALDGGDDGLDVFRRIIAAACGTGEGFEGAPLLREGGLLACELHETTLDAAAELCRAAGLADVRVEHDLTGRPRDILASRA